MNAKVFVSYAQEDHAAYSSLCLALDSSGVSRWDATTLTAGNSLAEGLRAAIDECDLCIFVATPRSVQSRWCMAELGAFWGASKRVVTFVADPTIKESDLPPQFQGNLWTTDAKKLLADLRNEAINPVKKTADGYSTVVGSMRVNVKFGRIEQYRYDDPDSLVALPANEYFDDECIHDRRSALGAFMQHHFKDNITDIQTLVQSRLSNEASTELEKTPGERAKSYGVGKCVFLDCPLSSNLRIAMAAVTTQRADCGLRADPAYIFDTATSLSRLVLNRRFTRLHVPLLGSGHGGLEAEVSLVCMLIAFGEPRRRLNQNLRELNIIVYKSANDTEALISDVTVRRALSFSARFLNA